MKIFKKNIYSIVSVLEDGTIVPSSSYKEYTIYLEDDFQRFLNNTVESKEVVPGDKLFFPGFINFSREKVRSWIRDNPKVSIVRSVKSATKIICNKQSLELFITDKSYKRKLITVNGKLIFDNNESKYNKKNACYFRPLKEEDEDQLRQIENYTKPWISPDILHDIVTKDNIIKYNEFKSMCELFDSSDKTMYDIGMITIFTSNIEKSLFYILLLIKLYYSKHIRYSSYISKITVRPIFEKLTKEYPLILDYDYNPKVESSEYEIFTALVRNKKKICIDRNQFNRIIKTAKKKWLENSNPLLDSKVPDINPEILKLIEYEKSK